MKRLSLLWMLEGWLVINPVFAATPEYLVIGAQPYELQEKLNAKGKEGWKLISVSTWTVDCPNNKKECLVVVLEKE